MRLKVPRTAASVGPLATGIGLRVVVAPLVLPGVGAVLGLDGDLAAGMSGLGVLPAVLLAPLWVGLAT